MIQIERAWLAIGILALAFSSLNAGAAPASRAATRPAMPPYPTAHDQPLAASETLASREKAYTKFRAEFNGIGGVRVPAFLYVPTDGKKKHPAILLQYGSGGNKNTNYIVAIGQQFAESGFVVLTIDIPGRGDRKKTEPRGGFIDLRFEQTLGDYSRAVDYLVSREDVDAQRIGYLGISWGAITGIPFAAHDERIKAVASLVGGGNFLGWLNDGMSEEQRKAAAQLDPVYHVGKIAPRPLLLINVTKDQLVPRFFAESLHKAAGANAKKMWIETDHIFSGIDRVALTRDIIKFIADGMPGE